MVDLTNEQVTQLQSEGYNEDKHRPVFKGDELVGFEGKEAKSQVIRNITPNAWWDRVTEEKEAIVRAIADDGLLAEPKDYTMSIRLRKIDNSEFVSLDNEKLVDSMEKLKLAGVFTELEVAEIFANGTMDEVPEANKKDYL